MTYGHCVQCDRPFDDLESHIAERKDHKGRKAFDTEKFSGVKECKVCRQLIETPRRPEGKWGKDEIPEHECSPARVIKDEHGRTLDIIDDNGMSLRDQKLILRPTGY